jgi:hypothetical protein
MFSPIPRGNGNDEMASEEPLKNRALERVLFITRTVNFLKNI